MKLERNGLITMKIDSIVKQELKNPEFAKEYYADKEKSASAIALYKARKNAGLTQAALAKKAGVPQSTIARIERGGNISFNKLAAIAFAMGKKLKVEFQ